MRKTTVPQSNVEPQNEFLYSVENADELKSADFDIFLKAIKRFVGINRLLTWLPIVASVLLIIGIVQSANGESPALSAISLFLLFGSLIAKIIYRFSGKVKAHYEFSDESEYRHSQIQKAINCVKSCAAVWQVNDVFVNVSKRTKAGADRSVNLTKTSIVKRKPFFLRTNATCYSIKLKKEKLYILPDVIIVVRKSKVGAVALKDLNILVTEKKFVADFAPKDAVVLSYTWQFVNNNGTPDRRFKNNRQLPVCLYGVIDMQTDEGFHTRFYLSNIQAAKDFSDIITEVIGNEQV